jgi:hypothetical protein
LAVEDARAVAEELQEMITRLEAPTSARTESVPATYEA